MDQRLKFESKTLSELKSSPVRPPKSSIVGFLLLSFSLDISVIVDRSGMAHATGNSCLRLEPQPPPLNMADPAPTRFVLVSSSLKRYHLEGGAGGGDSSDKSSVIRLLCETSVPRGLW